MCLHEEPQKRSQKTSKDLRMAMARDPDAKNPNQSPNGPNPSHRLTLPSHFQTKTVTYSNQTKIQGFQGPHIVSQI